MARRNRRHQGHYTVGALDVDAQRGALREREQGVAAIRARIDRARRSSGNQPRHHRCNMLRIALDTNQLVRALMRPPELATFVMAWQSRRFTIVCSRPLLDEYSLVLDYPEIAELIYPEVRRVFVTQLLDIRCSAANTLK